MRLEEFMQNVAEKIYERMGTVEIQTQEILKNNGIRIPAIIIRDGKSNISPCIYLNQFYKEYRDNQISIGDIVDEIIRMFEKYSLDDDINVTNFTDFSVVRERVQAYLINTNKNQELLKEVPHREFLDLSVVYYVDMEKPEDGCVRISNNLVQIWDVTEQKLYDLAKENMSRNDEGLVKNLADIVYEMTGEKDLELTEAKLIPMYILTNKKMRNGAGQMLNSNILKEAGNIIGKDFMILPSSTNEVLLIPAVEEKNQIDDLVRMVREVNDTGVPEHEILSYHVYRYNRDKQEFTIAG